MGRTHLVPLRWICQMIICNDIKINLNKIFVHFISFRLYQWTKILYAVAILLTYNLQFYVPFSLLWPRVCRKILYKYGQITIERCEHAFRISLILITCKWREATKSNSIFMFSLEVIVAALIPNIGLVISLGKKKNTTLLIELDRSFFFVLFQLAPLLQQLSQWFFLRFVNRSHFGPTVSDSIDGNWFSIYWSFPLAFTSLSAAQP